MKNFKKPLLILILLIVLVYVTNINSIPNSIIVFKGEDLNLKTVYGLTLEYNEKKDDETIQTSSKISNNSNTIEKQNITLKLFNILNVKNIEVNTIPETKVIPLGNSVGLKLYTSGVLVVGKTEINGSKPYENSGIEEGDMIIEINEKQITCTDELIDCVNSSNGKDLNIKYIRDGVEYVSNIEPTKTEGNEYKLGLWVRDGAAGIGTMTYYEPKTGKFAALGHGIVDIDTEKLVTISSGEVVTANIISVVKGEKENPGEIKGSLVSGKQIGIVGTNSTFGIYGNLSNSSELNINTNNLIEVASRDEIKKEKAKILLNIEDGVRKEYEIEITKIYKNNNTNNKSMQIKVTDPKLLELTGGIVQRNEWSSNNTKWEIYRSNNTRINK